MAAVPITLTPVSLTAASGLQVITSSNVFASSVLVEAESTNTNNIYFGASNVSSTNGYTLAAGKKLGITFDSLFGVNGKIDMSTIFFASDTTGNKVRVTYLRWDGG